MDAERFNDLPPETRRFLAGLKPGDVEMIAEGIALVRSLSRVSKLMRKIIIFVAATIIGTVALWKSIKEFGQLWLGK